jgi:hypothetical protein
MKKRQSLTRDQILILIKKEPEFMADRLYNILQHIEDKERRAKELIDKIKKL